MTETEEREFGDVDGIGPSTVDKIKDAGMTWESIAISSVNDISSRTDMGEKKARKLVKAARDVTGIGGFKGGVQVAEEQEQRGKIPFLVGELDDLLGGGIRQGTLTEIYGENSSGKTQMCFQLAVNVQLPESVGCPNESCIFIDTEDTFNTNRIGQMVRGLDPEVMEAVFEDRGLDDLTVEGVKNSELISTSNPQTEADILHKSFMENITWAHAINSDSQVDLARDVKEEAARLRDDPDKLDPGLLVVDSLIKHFRAEYVGRGELAERQQELNKHISDLKQFAEIYDSAVVYPNQVAANPDSYFGDPTNPAGGNIVGHASTYRIYLIEKKEPLRSAELKDAPDMMTDKCVFSIVGDGIKDENY
jgi:DNA repair protein RadA